jgi:hypothetical protein
LEQHDRATLLPNHEQNSRDAGGELSSNKSQYSLLFHYLPAFLGLVCLVVAGGIAAMQHVKATPSIKERLLLEQLRGGLAFHLVLDQAMSEPQLAPVDRTRESILRQEPRPGSPPLFFKVGKEPALTGVHLLSARLEVDELGSKIIMLKFNPAGTTLFADLTGQHIGEQLAIVFKGQVLSAPIIQARIAGGEAQITGQDLSRFFDPPAGPAEAEPGKGQTP